MCGRLYIKFTPAHYDLLSELGILSGEVQDQHNMAPTENIPVVHHEPGTRLLTLRPMRWWLHPSWLKEAPTQRYGMFNARIETVLSSKAFKTPVSRRRGLVLAGGFVEWQRAGTVKQPFYCEPLDPAQPLVFAAIWDCWGDSVYSCAIITQPADEYFRPIHDRMPLTLTIAQAHQWLDASRPASSRLLKNPPFPTSRLFGRPNLFQDKILEKIAFKSASE